MNKSGNIYTPEVALLGIANRLREKYWLRKAMSDPREKTYNPVWKDLAREISARAIEPADFIAAQFSDQFCPPHAPRPRDLLHKHAFESHKIYMKARRAEMLRGVEISLNSYFQLLRAKTIYFIESEEMTEESAVAYAYGEFVGMQPLIVYLFIDRCEIANKSVLLDHLFADACIQYVLRQDLFDTAIGKFIPEEFRIQAVKAYLEMFGHPISP